MATVALLREIALALPEATEAPHFEKISFRVNKKIFATLNVNEGRATVKLPAIEQDVFCTFNANVVYPVPNKWGKQGWTHVNLQSVTQEMLTELLKTAYKGVAPQRLANQISFE